jgi:hypothetical protein
VSFIHPFLAWGAILGLIPIIIHYLWRRRFRVVRWAAVDFLLAALSRRSRRVWMEDAILLCLRVLALVAAALLVARPVLSPSAARAVRIRRDPVDAVVVLDTSYSMSTDVGGQTRAAIARKRAQDLLRSLPDGSRAALLRTDELGAPEAAQLTTDLALVAAAAGSVGGSASAAGVLSASRAAVRILEASKASEAGAHSRRGVYLVTDAQARLFEDDGPRLGSLFREADPGISLIVLSVPNGPAPNLAVTGIAVKSRCLAVGVPVEIEVTINDPGEPPLADVGLELYIDGRKVERARARLAGRAALVRFHHAFTAAGTYSVEARLDPDAVDADNHRYLTVHVPASIDVAVISGDDKVVSGDGKFISGDKKSPGDGGAHVYVEAALSSGGAGAGDLAPLPLNVRPRLSPDRPGAELARALDDSVWVAVMADPGPLPAALIDRLRDFVFHGGAILIAGGPDAARTLGPLRSGRDGPGAWLGEVEVAVPDAGPEKEGAPLRLDPAAIAVASSAGGSPGVLPLFDPEAGGLPETLAAVSFFKALDIRPAPDSGWSVPLRFTDGRPAVLARAPLEPAAQADVRPGAPVGAAGAGRAEDTVRAMGAAGAAGAVGAVRAVGAGRIILFASTLDPRWSDLPYRPAMVPFLAECIEWLVRDRQVAPEIQPGRPWTLRWLADDVRSPSADSLGDLAVICPDGNSLAAATFTSRIAESNESVLRFEPTGRPGTYRLEGKGLPGTFGARAAVSVNVDAAESSQEVWTLERIAALLPEGRCRGIDAGSPLDPAAVEGASGPEIWPQVAAVLGLLLLLESLLGWWFALQGAPATMGAPAREGAGSRGSTRPPGDLPSGALDSRSRRPEAAGRTTS